jgi:hypothetical protein
MTHASTSFENDLTGLGMTLFGNQTRQRDVLAVMLLFHEL